MKIEVFKLIVPEDGRRKFVIRTDYEIDGSWVYIGSTEDGFEVFVSSKGENWKFNYILVGIEELPEYVQKYIGSEFFEIDLRKMIMREQIYDVVMV